MKVSAKDFPHPSIAGHQGAGTTLVLMLGIFALWFSITKRLPNMIGVIKGPSPVDVPPGGTASTGAGAGGSGAGVIGGKGHGTADDGSLSGLPPFMPKWDPAWGPKPKEWVGG